MDRADTLAMLVAAGLGRVAGDLDRLMQPSIRMTSRAVAETSLSVGVSRLGGSPDLAPDVPWPEWRDVPLAFVAQIRLEEVQPYDVGHLLPPSGMLSFFYDARQQTFGDDPAGRGSWRVLYDASGPGHLQRRPAPAALPSVGRFTACAVTFAGEFTLPQEPGLEIPDLDWTPDELKRYEAVLAMYPSQADQAAIRHRLLGHPDTLQDDMRLECQLAAYGVKDPDDPRAAQLARGALNWQLLLQVDSDEHAGMRWGDAGMIYYWIEREALAARRFDNAWLVLQSD